MKNIFFGFALSIRVYNDKFNTSEDISTNADRSNKRWIELFLSLLMVAARPGFISQSPVLKSIPLARTSSPRRYHSWLSHSLFDVH